MVRLKRNKRQLPRWWQIEFPPSAISTLDEFRVKSQLRCGFLLAIKEVSV